MARTEARTGVIVAVRKRKIEGRAKVKTGCVTCRIRKVKCDEGKPSCLKCVKTGRTCDGYESLFRIAVCPPQHHVQVVLQPAVKHVTPEGISVQDVDILSRCFHTKTLFDVKLGTDEEAKQVLLAALTDPHISHAVSCLIALRNDLETAGDGPAATANPTPNHHDGLRMYSKALGGLASNLSSPSTNVVKSALLCCQIFISIEQVRKDYTAMIQHIIRGLNIMHEFRARPALDNARTLVPSCPDQLPLLDVFIIKLFAAPCGFADRGAADTAPEVQSSIPSPPESVTSDGLRTIAPNMRGELTRIAGSTLEFLKEVSDVRSGDTALRLLPKRTVLLNGLQSWFRDLETMQAESDSSGLELISVSFLRMFHLILKIVLLAALESSPDLKIELKRENEKLQSLADDVGERVKTYVMCSGSGGDQPRA